MNRMQKFVPALLMVALTASCALFSAAVRPVWVEGTVASDSESVLYEVIHISLQKAGYPVGIGADKGSRKVASGWFKSDYPFKGKGYRQMATVTYSPSEAGEFGIQVRVQRELNESFRPLDPRYADWEETDDNRTEAERILQYIRSFLAGDDLKVGPQPAVPGRG